MHGLGNDFVVIDQRGGGLSLPRALRARLADRHFGIGCDQLIVLEASEKAAARMRIFNPDGGEVEACGNATRCIGMLLARENGGKEARIETLAGLIQTRLDGARVAVDMGLPRLDWPAIPLAGPVADTARVPMEAGGIDPALPNWFSAVNMGNPHAVFFLEAGAQIDLARVGPLLEHHPLFPQKANISFVTLLSRRILQLRVWERAAGLTLACGTAACASAVAAIRLGLAERAVEVRLPGGALEIRQEESGRVTMIGPATDSFSGFVAPELLSLSEPIGDEEAA